MTIDWSLSGTSLPHYFNLKMSVTITFFAKMPFRTGPDRHWARISTIIRAVQIATCLGVKLNPTQGYKNDVCVYVKPPYKRGNDFSFEGKKAYLDVVDELGFCDLLRKHPESGVLSLSDWNFRMLKKVLPNNKVVNIPQQHCNFERLKRIRREIMTVGIIGALNAIAYLPKGLKEALAQRGMELIEFSKFTTRQDVVNFYMDIDVQIVWRPYFDYSRDILMNPLKIVNASSFGIPTIAYSEPVFEEMSGCYIPVHTLDEFLTNLDNLRSHPDLYDEYSKRCLEKAKKYHIEKIAQLYKNLST